MSVNFVAYVDTCNGNCPICIGFDFYKLIKFDAFDDVLVFALKNMNDLHIRAVIDINNDDQYEFKYGGQSKHSFHSIEAFKNSHLIALTFDIGNGNLYWEYKDAYYD
jgi:hypothetical protein